MSLASKEAENLYKRIFGYTFDLSCPTCLKKSLQIKRLKISLDKLSHLGYTKDMEKIIKDYFKKIGQKGGKAKSLKKTIAVRKNGLKGGRPKGKDNGNNHSDN